MDAGRSDKLRLAAGARLGPYEVLAPLGSGGMGEVYRARDERLGREVAVKVLPASSSADPDRLSRFEQEAKAAGALNPPNLVAVFDTGAHEGNHQSAQTIAGEYAAHVVLPVSEASAGRGRAS
jgi:serine/threonine protein kinase